MAGQFNDLSDIEKQVAETLCSGCKFQGANRDCKAVTNSLEFIEILGRDRNKGPNCSLAENFSGIPENRKIQENPNTLTGFELSKSKR